MTTSEVAERVDGHVAPGWEPVADEFRRGFRERGEVGAALAVVVDGETVVDLWGGARDERTGAPWERDTLVPVFSTTKGISAICLAVAHSRGLLDHDAPVAATWPEFAARGKGDVTVRQLLAHQAGLSHVDFPLTLGLLADPDRLAAVLADQRPSWAPGTRHGYHAISFGWYAGALLRSADPSRRTIGRFLADEVAGPLGLEVHLGVTAALDRSRIARITPATPVGFATHVRDLPKRFAVEFLLPWTRTHKAFANPPLLQDMESYNRPDVQAVELPGSNAVVEARGVAALYGDVATGGSRLGLTAATCEALAAPPVEPSGGPRDLVLHVDTAYALGFSRPTGLFRFGGAQGRAFGTPGAGGSFGFADPEHGLGFCYAPNRAGYRIRDDSRELPLREAVLRVLGGPPQTAG